MQNWIQEIGARFKTGQIKAASHVNKEMLRFYWFIGKGISERKAQNKYGSDFFHNLSIDLGRLLPGIKSFSVTNLKYMRYFYDLYKCPSPVDESEKGKNRPQIVDDLDLDQSIFCIP